MKRLWMVAVILPALMIVRPLPRDAGGAPSPKMDKPASGVLVLDDCDQQFRGKQTYEDNLSSFDASGKLLFRVSGFNNCEAIGSNHPIAVDAKRGWIWALETVGNRIRKFDRKGKELLAIKEIKGHAIATDPATGNLWVLTSSGTIYGEKTAVYDPKGKSLATYAVSGWDIAYDPKDKAFWIAGPNLSKVDAKTGKVAFAQKITTWCASSLAVHHKTGKVWVAVRRHPQVQGSKEQLLGFDKDGTLKHTVELGDKTPFHVSVDQKSGAVWVAIFGQGVRRYSAEGKKEAEHKFEALCAEADLSTGDIWVVTPTEVLRGSPKGKVLKRQKHRSKTSQAWVVAF